MTAGIKKSLNTLLIVGGFVLLAAAYLSWTDYGELEMVVAMPNVDEILARKEMASQFIVGPDEEGVFLRTVNKLGQDQPGERVEITSVPTGLRNMFSPVSGSQSVQVETVDGDDQ